jgi:hypothetical protein
MRSQYKRLVCALGIVLAGAVGAEEGTDFVVPEGFEVTALEPLGGRVARPLTWSYQTGVRIQLIAAVEAKTGQNAKAFIEEFLAGRRSSAEVVMECEVEDQGLLTRTCIQTQELIPNADADEPFRIQYTVFWGNQVDVALFVTAGTVVSLWDEFAPVFAEIEKFELIDLNRFDASGRLAEPKEDAEGGEDEGAEPAGEAAADDQTDRIKADGVEQRAD